MSTTHDSETTPPSIERLLSIGQSPATTRTNDVVGEKNGTQQGKSKPPLDANPALCRVARRPDRAVEFEFGSMPYSLVQEIPLADIPRTPIPINMAI